MEALHREVSEEGGVKVKYLQQFGYLEVDNTHTKQDKYPPTGYVVFWCGEIYGDVSEPDGKEVQEAAFFSIQEIEEMDFPSQKIVMAGISFYRNSGNYKI